MPLTHVYRIDTREPEVILSEGFAGSANPAWNNRLYGANTVFCSRSVRGLFSYCMERMLGRSGERVESPYNTARFFPRERFRRETVFAYRINIVGLEHLEVTPSLGFTYPPLNAQMQYDNDEGMSQLDLASPLIRQFLDGDSRDETMGLAYIRSRYVLLCARYTEEVLVRGPIPPERIHLYQTLPATPIGQRVRRARPSA